MEKKTYNIGRFVYTQQELSFKQEKRFLKLIKRVISRFSDDDEISFTPAAFYDILVKYNLFETAFGVFLKPKWNASYIVWKIGFTVKYLFSFWRVSYYQVNLNAASYDLRDQIIKDFFLFNKNLMTRLEDFGGAFAAIARAGMKMSEEKAAAPPSTPSKRKTRKAKSSPEKSA